VEKAEPSFGLLPVTKLSNRWEFFEQRHCPLRSRHQFTAAIWTAAQRQHTSGAESALKRTDVGPGGIRR